LPDEQTKDSPLSVKALKRILATPTKARNAEDGKKSSA
jgi:hypothetical protein